jgi:ABC-type multidrug transport system ATPase subunit
VRQRSARVDQALAATDSIHLADRLVDALDVAQRRHVELSRALLHQPKVVLMDSPADGLTDAAWVALEQQIRRVAEGGATMVLTGCVYNRMVDLCDPVAVIVDGRMRAFGTPAQLASHFARWRTIEVRFASAAQTGRAADVLGDLVDDATQMVCYEQRGLMRIATDAGDAQVARWVAAIVEQGLQITSVRELEVELDASMLRLRQDSAPR